MVLNDDIYIVVNISIDANLEDLKEKELEEAWVKRSELKDDWEIYRSRY